VGTRLRVPDLVASLPFAHFLALVSKLAALKTLRLSPQTVLERKEVGGAGACKVVFSVKYFNFYIQDVSATISNNRICRFATIYAYYAVVIIEKPENVKCC
jgi:hypothetical protein